MGGGSMNWTVAVAIASAIASVLAAGAAFWSAGLAASSNRHAAQERRAALEREANRSIHQVLAGASRVLELSDALDRAHTSAFALHGRNVGAAKPLHDQVATKRAEAQVMRESAHECDWQNLKGISDSELEVHMYTMEGHLARLGKLEDSLAFDLRSVEEDIRQARDRVLRKNLAPPPAV